MSVKPVESGDLLMVFADYLTKADLMAAKALAKVSAAISKKRIDMGMTQKQFADYMGVSQGMVSKWEGDDYNFSIETLAKICEKLELSLDIEMKSESEQFKHADLRNKITRANAAWNVIEPACFKKDGISEAV